MSAFLQDLKYGVRLLIPASWVYGGRRAGPGARHRRQYGGVHADQHDAAQAAAGRAGRRTGRRVFARPDAAGRLSRVLVSQLRGPARSQRSVRVACRARLRHGRRSPRAPPPGACSSTSSPPTTSTRSACRSSADARSRWRKSGPAPTFQSPSSSYGMWQRLGGSRRRRRHRPCALNGRAVQHRGCRRARVRRIDGHGDAGDCSCRRACYDSVTNDFIREGHARHARRSAASRAGARCAV